MKLLASLKAYKSKPSESINILKGMKSPHFLQSSKKVQINKGNNACTLYLRTTVLALSLVSHDEHFIS